MKYSAMTYSFGRVLDKREMTLDDVLDFLVRAGFDGVDLDFSHLHGYSAGDLSKRLSDLGLQPACLSVFAELTSLDDATRHSAVQRVGQAARYAAEISCPVMLIVAGFVSPGEQDHVRPVLIEALHQCVSSAVQLGVTPTIEPFPGQRSPFVTGGEIISVCQAVGPELKVTFDVANAATGGEDPFTTLDMLRPRIVHAHAKNFTVQDCQPDSNVTCCQGRDGKWYCGTSVGEGIIPVRRVLGRLVRGGYEGYIAWEYEGEEAPCQEAAGALKYLHSCVQDALST